MGNIYPVTEHPSYENSLNGKPCKEGFDSHYLVVNKSFPVEEGGIPDSDEFVVFNQDQILPRYIVYYHRTLEFNNDISNSLLLWIDDKLYSRENLLLITRIQELNNKVRIHQFSSTVEFKVWLQNHQNDILQFIKVKKIKNYHKSIS